MKINDFIHFNKNCPCCDNILTLFMVSHASRNPVIWKGEIDKNSLNFYQQDSSKIIKILESDSDHVLDSSNMERSLWTEDFYFFYLCNPRAIKIKYMPYDFEINAFDACYYRSTPLMRCWDRHDGIITASNPSEENFINAEQVFRVIYQSEDFNKAYILSLDYLDNETVFWHYTYKDSLEINDDSKIMEIKMPILNSLPSFHPSQRDKLLEKFNCWILMS